MLLLFYIFITLLHEILCIYKKTKIYYNAVIGDFKIQNTI